MTPLATQTLALGPAWLDPNTIIEWLGPWALVGVAAIIFAECGLLLGFFLPGDSLLFTAGLFVATGGLGAPLWLACIVLVLAAVLGNAVGYGIGYQAGPAIFDKPKSKLFNPKHVGKTHEFFEKYGNRAIVLGRFVPIVRTFITVSAGVARMEPRRYLTYSLIGGVAWAAGVTVLGYFLGQIAFVRDHIELILVLVVLLSVVPIAIEVLRARSGAKRSGPAPAAAGAPGVAESDLTQPIAVPDRSADAARGTGWDGPDGPGQHADAPQTGRPDRETRPDADATAATTRMAPVTGRPVPPAAGARPGSTPAASPDPRTHRNGPGPGGPTRPPRAPSDGAERGPLETRSTGRPVMGYPNDRPRPDAR